MAESFEGVESIAPGIDTDFVRDKLRQTMVLGLPAEDHIPVRLNLHDGGIELSVIRQEVGEETEHIEGAYTGEEMTIAFNTRYLTEGVSAIDSDTIILETIDALKPGLLHGEGDEDFRYLLMPVRL